FFDLRVPFVFQLEALEPNVDRSKHIATTTIFDLGKKEELFDDLHLPIETALLWQITDAVLGMSAVAVRPIDRSRIGVEDPRDHSDGGGFAGPVAAEEASDGA